MKFLRTFLKDESGQDLIEYSLLIAFIMVAAVTLIAGAGSGPVSIWHTANRVLSNAVIAAS